MEPKKLNIDLKDALTVRYKARKAGAGNRTIQTVIPYEVVEREARRAGLSVDDFLKEYEILFRYNHFGGVHFEFVPREKKIDAA